MFECIELMLTQAEDQNQKDVQQINMRCCAQTKNPVESSMAACPLRSRKESLKVVDIDITVLS